MVGQEFHVRRAVEQDFARDRWQRVRQVPQLVVSVRKTAVVLEFADAGLQEVATDLGFVIGVYGTDVMPSWIIFGHWLNKIRRSISNEFCKI